MSFLARVSGLVRAGFIRVRLLWSRFRALPIWKQVVAWVIFAAVLSGIIFLLHYSAPSGETANVRAVSVEKVAELSGSASGVAVLGTVRSESEAQIIAQAGGTVEAVHTVLGANVPAGFVIAELENASERAVVLQAEGAYDAAVAARSALSLPESQAVAVDTYQKAYATIDTVIHTDIDAFFGTPTPYGPILLLEIGNDTFPASLSRRRADLDKLMETWREGLPMAGTADPLSLLNQAYDTTNTISDFLNDLARIANDRASGETATQSAALTTARTEIDALLSDISSARTSYRVGSTQATAGSDASVKQALGALRGAQANLEKTLVRAPIAGTVNFLPIRRGDYVTQLTHVATVAQNGALEIVAYISEENRASLEVGKKISVNDIYGGVITAIAPALDPSTKQIEVRIAVDGASDLVNGESVRVTLPQSETLGTVTSAGPILLALSAVKLSGGSSFIFTVAADNRARAQAVSIGDVHSDKIEITSPIDPDLLIVTDVRGLSDGQLVRVASSTGQ
jgi:RND family efflux transporter MFP subunit